MTNNASFAKMLERRVETKAESIKLGMYLPARDVVVGGQFDGALPHRPQKMTTAGLRTLVRGLLAAGRQVYACYEAGPCGYGRHRALLIERVWRLTRWQPDCPPVKALVAGIARGAAQTRRGRGAQARGRPVAPGDRPDHARETPPHRPGGGARPSQPPLFFRKPTAPTRG